MRIPQTGSGFVRNFSVLVTGTAVAQAIPVLLQPLLRRVFDADLFALFAVYNSVSSILIVATTLRYEMAIVLPERDRDALHITWLALAVNLVFALLSFALVALMPDRISGWIAWPDGARGWLYMLPLAVMLFSAAQTMNYWLIRKKAFKASAYNRVGRRVTEGVMQSGGGLAGWQGALLWGELLGRGAFLFMAFSQSLKKGFTHRHIEWSEMKRVAARYRDFPLFQTLPALLNTLSLMVPVLMINSYYTAKATADFDLCRQVLMLPLALITTAMSQLLLQKFSEQRNRKLPIMPGFLKLTLFNTAFAVGVVVFFRLAGRPLFVFVFGEEWGTAGEYAALLAPAFMLQFIVSPLSTLIVALEKIRLGALWQVILFAGVLSLAAFRHLDERTFLAAFTWIIIGLYLIYWLLLFFIVARYEKSERNS